MEPSLDSLCLCLPITLRTQSRIQIINPIALSFPCAHACVCASARADTQKPLPGYECMPSRKHSSKLNVHAIPITIFIISHRPKRDINLLRTSKLYTE